MESARGRARRRTTTAPDREARGRPGRTCYAGTSPRRRGTHPVSRGLRRLATDTRPAPSRHPHHPAQHPPGAAQPPPVPGRARGIPRPHRRPPRGARLARAGHHAEGESEVRSVTAEQVRLLGQTHPDGPRDLGHPRGGARRHRPVQPGTHRGAPGVQARPAPLRRRPSVHEVHPPGATAHNLDWSDTTRPKPSCRASDVFSNTVSEINIPHHRHNDE